MVNAQRTLLSCGCTQELSRNEIKCESLESCLLSNVQLFEWTIEKKKKNIEKS